LRASRYRPPPHTDISTLNAEGGNTGTTLGQQRLIAFQHAASIWSARLDSNVPIRIRAQFTALAPGILGSAGTNSIHANFRCSDRRRPRGWLRCCCESTAPSC
jgi:hypothetical protein